MVLLRRSEGRWNAYGAAARAGFGNLKLWQQVAIAILGTIALYYLLIAIVGRPYASVCRKADGGGADHCEQWDVLWASVVWLAWRADEHNGFVSAFAGLAVAGFTGVLWRSTEKLWIAGEKQHRLARDEFIATHRPRILLRGFQLMGELNDSEPFGFMFSAYNVGESVAHIISVRSGVLVHPDNKRIPGNVGFFFYEPLELSLASGTHDLIPGNGGHVLTEAENVGAWAGVSSIYAMGVVTYLDESKAVQREVGFCRRYRPREQEWDAVEGDYEYSF